MKKMHFVSIDRGNKQWICKSLIDRYEVITFDVFDTLLKRQVLNPNDVFSYEERVLLRRHGEIFKGFKSRRLQAEIRAREKNKKQECSLRQIYEEIFPSDDGLIDECMELEESLELQLCIGNDDIRQIYDYCVEQKKTIFYISDMYLSSDCIAKMLANAKYNVYKGQIYVSNEFSANKRTGELFNIFLMQQKIEPSNILHIGDSRYADYIGPLRVGIKAIHIPRYVNHCIYPVEESRSRKLNLDDRLLKTIINNTTVFTSNRFERIGCECFAPVVIGYVLWLKQQVSKYRIKKYIFLARDSYLFYQTFKKYCQEELIDCEYAYISRKSIRLAYFVAIDNYEDICVTFPTQKLTIADILGEIGFEPCEFSDYIRDAGMSGNERFNMRDEILDSHVKKVLSHIHSSIPLRYMEKARLVTEYLKQVGFFSESSAAVDIGWHGSLQLMLEQILSKNGAPSVPFFYFGTLKGSAKRLKGLEYYSYALNENKKIDEVSLIYVLERFIPEYVGSAKEYVKTENGNDTICIEPLLEEADFSDFIIGKSIQHGCMIGVNNFFGLGIPAYGITDEISYSSLTKFVSEPKMEDAVSIGDIEFFDGIKYNMAKPANIRKYIANPEEFLLDIQKARWREAFFLRLFRVRLPWAKMFTAIKNIYMLKKHYK